mmetsp:Transcript_15907/g.37577  ORF Transcript_15907/g.37577 Transcript_15907/m.37577 type:complete len:258 (+) Transcript_15907:675-1448(+)
MLRPGIVKCPLCLRGRQTRYQFHKKVAVQQPVALTHHLAIPDSFLCKSVPNLFQLHTLLSAIHPPTAPQLLNLVKQRLAQPCTLLYHHVVVHDDRQQHVQKDDHNHDLKCGEPHVGGRTGYPLQLFEVFVVELIENYPEGEMKGSPEIAQVLHVPPEDEHRLKAKAGANPAEGKSEMEHVLAGFPQCFCNNRQPRLCIERLQKTQHQHEGVDAEHDATAPLLLKGCLALREELADRLFIGLAICGSFRLQDDIHGHL